MSTNNAIVKMRNVVQDERVQERFQQILESKAPAFLSSLLSLVHNDAHLQKCEPSTILNSAAKAAVLDLPIEQSLGFAYIVPFKNKAEFVLGYKGYIQLALRSGVYEVINATEVYQGEQITENRLTGEIKLNGNKINDEVIGYAAYFRMKNGYEKYIYMTREQVEEHAKKYSKSYSYKGSAWQTDFDAMGKKTVLRRLLGKWGLLSITMQDADMPLVEGNGSSRLTEMEEDVPVPEFEDVVEGELRDAEEGADLETQIIEAAIKQGFTDNEHSARNTLKKCTVEFENISEGVGWFKVYRAWRDMGDNPDGAAKSANKGELPQ